MSGARPASPSHRSRDVAASPVVSASPAAAAPSAALLPAAPDPLGPAGATGPRLLVRDAEPRDLDAVTALVRELATSFDPDEERVADAVAELVDGMRVGEGAHERLRVAEAEGVVVGYCLASVHRTLHANGPSAWVEELVVDPAWRGRGVGSALMADVEAWAVRRGAAVVALATRRAGGFYAGLGYAESAAYLRKVLPPEVRRPG